MSGPYHVPLPSIRALRIFESAVRHLSFSAAAEECHTTQPAVSRTIADLERRLSVRLFERDHRIIRLTEAGEIFHRSVAIGMERIAAGVIAASSIPEGQRVVVACGHGTSHLFVMPRFEALRRALGEDICLRILTLDYDMLDRMDDSEVDLMLIFEKNSDASEDMVAVFNEAITPVCSPGFAATHTQILDRPVAEWSSMPFLRLARSAQCWATWHDWFESAGYPEPLPRYTGIEDYVYLLEAVISGQGLALGWRHFIDHHIDSGTLVTVSDSFVELDRGCFARFTKRGRLRPVAHQCLDAFVGLASEPPRLVSCMS
ncbi:MAG: LysR family transcriptional regulator [Gammaproteobacteria bacterium]|nr:LysR family transcriptional regulator [Gammaproteobacteria bacterium]